MHCQGCHSHAIVRRTDDVKGPIFERNCLYQGAILEHLQKVPLRRLARPRRLLIVDRRRRIARRRAAARWLHLLTAQLEWTVHFVVKLP